jgi:hypothetical protein
MELSMDLLDILLGRRGKPVKRSAATAPATGPGLAATVGPAALEVTPRHVIVGDTTPPPSR